MGIIQLFYIFIQQQKETKYSLILVSVTSIGAVWVVFHQSGVMKTKKDKNEDYCSIPMSIYMLGLVLSGVSSFQYFNNTALRRFTLKTLQNKILVITSFKDATIHHFSREGFIMKMGID